MADRTGLTRRTLRHYDELGLLIPAGRSGGDYRLYDEDDLLRLLQIQNLKALGLSLPEIADALADPIVRIRAALQPSATSTRDLVEALTDETDPAVREVLMWSLAQQPDAAEAALARLDDPDPELAGVVRRLLLDLHAT